MLYLQENRMESFCINITTFKFRDVQDESRNYMQGKKGAKPAF